MALIADLKPNSNFDVLELEITSKGESRTFNNFKGTGQVCNLAGKDSTGKEVKVTLWNEQITQVNQGNNIKIENGWCTEFRGEIQVAVGKKGTLTVL